MSTYFLMTGVIIVLGLLIHVFKLHNLIAGYNTMSKERKRNVDIEGLAKFMGITLYVFAAITLGFGVLELFGIDDTIMIWVALNFVMVVFILIYSKKYEHDTPFQGEENGLEEEAKSNPNIKNIVTIIIIAISLLFAGGINWFGMKPVDIVVTDTDLELNSLMYGEVIPLNQIEDIELLLTHPEVLEKINGYALGSIRKGNFDVTGYGEITLMTNSDVEPLILLITNQGTIILNDTSHDETLSLYELIRTKLDQ